MNAYSISVSVSVSLSVSLSVYHSVCLSVSLSVCLSLRQLPIKSVLLVIFEIEEVLERTEILIFIKIVRFSQFRIHKK